MRLSIPTPPDWTRRRVADGELLRAPDRALELLVFPIGGAKPDPEAWLRAALIHRTRQADPRPTNVETAHFETAAGWPAILIEATIGTEARLVAYLSFLDYAATVIAICGDPSITGWRERVLGVLAAATPDFSGDRIVCLADVVGNPPPRDRQWPREREGQWRRAFSGGDAVLVLEDDPKSGWIRFSSGLTPMRAAADLFLSFGRESGPGEIGVTAEGEYYAIATSERNRTQRTLAVVFGDNSYSRIEAATTEPEKFELFSTAVRGFAHRTKIGLGVGRLRPYYYEPPANWVGLARHGSALWISPSCGRHYQALRVFDARPPEKHEAVRSCRFETLATEFTVTPPRGPAVYFTAHDLECRVNVFGGKLLGHKSEIRVIDGVVIDNDYLYPLRIECEPQRLEESMHVFEELVRTIVPLPAQSTDFQPDLSVLSNWAS